MTQLRVFLWKCFYAHALCPDLSLHDFLLGRTSTSVHKHITHVGTILTCLSMGITNAGPSLFFSSFDPCYALSNCMKLRHNSAHLLPGRLVPNDQALLTGAFTLFCAIMMDTFAGPWHARSTCKQSIGSALARTTKEVIASSNTTDGLVVVSYMYLRDEGVEWGVHRCCLLIATASGCFLFEQVLSPSRLLSKFLWDFGGFFLALALATIREFFHQNIVGV